MTIGTLAPKADNKKPRKKKEVVDENAPLLPKTQETDAEFHEFNGASFTGAVFNLSTTVIGAGIMGLPACVKKLGMVPGLLAIILTALLTEKAIEFMIRFSRAGNISSYGSLMGDAFGKYGKASVELCIVIGNIGILIVYMIIIGKTLFLSLVLIILYGWTFTVIIRPKLKVA
jgi:sodium-coupled neutral amino acid transporter 2